MSDCKNTEVYPVLISPDYEQLIKAQFGSEIPPEYGTVIIRIYPNRLLQWGRAIKISDRVDFDMILDRYCVGAAIVHEKELIFVLYREKSELKVEEYVGKPIFKRIVDQVKTSFAS
jgi:hypothetical protein